MSDSVAVLRRVAGLLLVVIAAALVLIAIGGLVWTLADRGLLDAVLVP